MVLYSDRWFYTKTGASLHKQMVCTQTDGSVPGQMVLHPKQRFYTQADGSSPKQMVLFTLADGSSPKQMVLFTLADGLAPCQMVLFSDRWSSTQNRWFYT
jgi:hypothetical protein